MRKYILEIWKCFSGIMPVTASRIMFYKTNKKVLNLVHPVWFDEKLQYLKLYKYSKDPLVSVCADKFEVRSYVKKCGCEDILNTLIFNKAFLSEEDIPWDELPDQFVIKCTHGCHMNIICTSKQKFNVNEAKKKLKKWLKEKQWKEQAEIHYKKIQPRIIVEKYIPFAGNEKNQMPIDYKIYCFNGEPKVVMICYNRSDSVKFNYYDIEGNSLSHVVKKELWGNTSLQLPKSIDDMILYSKKLISGGDFPFVRIDFYELNNTPIFGEMTFTPSGCNDDDLTLEGQLYLGKLLNIDGEFK